MQVKQVKGVSTTEAGDPPDGEITPAWGLFSIRQMEVNSRVEMMPKKSRDIRNGLR